MTNETQDKLSRDAARLATNIAPQRDLWPDIEAAINAADAPQVRGFMPYLAQAAAILPLVGASSGITYLAMKPGTDISPGAKNGALTVEPASWGGGYEMSNDYTLARESLKAQLAVELERLSPEARADVVHNLKVIRNAIAEINAALQREPENVFLQDLLLDSYREELTVMRKINGLTQSVMARNDI